MTKVSDGNLTVSSNIFSDLCYSNEFGIMRDPAFCLRDYTENNFVLIYTIKGQLVGCQSGKNFSCEKGKYLLLDKRILHSYHFNPEIPSEIFWMHINGTLAAELITKISSLSPLPFLGKDARVLEKMKDIFKMKDGDEADLFEISSEISRLLHVILKEAHDEHRKNIYSAEEYFFRNEMEKIFSSSNLTCIDLNYLCKLMKMNKYYFSHRFHEYYGVSPMKYLKGMKLEKAKYLLKYSDTKISSIAQKCGFSSHTYFSSVFRKEFGISPEEYRQKRGNRI